MPSSLLENEFGVEMFLLRKILMLAALGFISVDLLSASYTAPDVITNMTVGKDFVRVKTASITAVEGCTKAEWYILPYGEGSAEIYSMLLAAKASAQKVHFQLIGCHLDYPRIIHIYNCDNASCTN